MTNRNALSRNFYNSDPFALQRAIARKFMGWDPYQIFSLVAQPQTDEEINISQYTDRTTDGESFAVYTSGDYPRLRIIKDLEDNTLKGLIVYASVPGLLEDEVSVNVLGQEITIETIPKGKLDQSTLIVNEIPNRHSKVVVGINGPFEMENVNAQFEQSGMLKIYVPATEKPKSKPIAIKSGSK